MEGRELKRERLWMDLKQEDLAKILELTPATISRYENGAQAIPKTIEYSIKYLRQEFDRKESSTQQW